MSREVIQLAVMMYVRFLLSLRNVEDLLHERGIDVCHESIVSAFGSIGLFRYSQSGYDGIVSGKCV
jgi:transposase-like protein